MNQMLDWHPTEDEVKAILDELRPVIAELAQRQQERLARGAVPRPA